jgi:hypothetical protein
MTRFWQIIASVTSINASGEDIHNTSSGMLAHNQLKKQFFFFLVDTHALTSSNKRDIEV